MKNCCAKLNIRFYLTNFYFLLRTTVDQYIFNCFNGAE